MNGIVVTSVEQLKSVRKSRSHPNILIRGELANNLLISGMLRVKQQSDEGEGEVTHLKIPDSGLYPVCEILCDLAKSNLFKIGGSDGQWQIKIYPKPLLRREGN